MVSVEMTKSTMSKHYPWVKVSLFFSSVICFFMSSRSSDISLPWLSAVKAPLTADGKGQTTNSRSSLPNHFFPCSIWCVAYVLYANVCCAYHLWSCFQDYQPLWKGTVHCFTHFPTPCLCYSSRCYADFRNISIFFSKNLVLWWEVLGVVRLCV